MENFDDFIELIIPSAPSDKVPRDAFVRQIGQNFNPECHKQRITGDLKSGKTNLLPQFVRQHRVGESLLAQIVTHHQSLELIYGLVGGDIAGIVTSGGPGDGVQSGGLGVAVGGGSDGVTVPVGLGLLVDDGIGGKVGVMVGGRGDGVAVPVEVDVAVDGRGDGVDVPVGLGVAVGAGVQVVVGGKDGGVADRVGLGLTAGDDVAVGLAVGGKVGVAVSSCGSSPETGGAVGISPSPNILNARSSKVIEFASVNSTLGCADAGARLIKVVNCVMCVAR